MGPVHTKGPPPTYIFQDREVNRGHILPSDYAIVSAIAILMLTVFLTRDNNNVE